MTILGRDPQGQNVWLYPEERLTGMYVIGANGTGKSTLLLNMISQDIEQGRGVCLLDPHGDLTNNVIRKIPPERINDVILLNPLDVEYPFGLNLFTCLDMHDPAQVEHAVEQIVQIFSKVFGMGVETPRLNQYVRHISYSLVGSGYTMCEIPLLLLDKSFRDTVVANVTSTSTRLFWRAFDGLRTNEQLERSESTLDRIDSIISNSIIRNIVGQRQTTVDFREIMDSGKILLVSLSAQYESLTSLLGSIIIGQLLTAALNRAGSTKRRQFNLYADEYQRFATPDFSTLLTEARKFGVATTIAHQVRSQLDEKNAATALQAGSLVCFRLTSEDSEELAGEFLLLPKDAIKPEQTIPTNCLEYIDRNPHPIVKYFVLEYVNKIREAMKVTPDWNEYYKKLEVFLYKTMVRKEIDKEELLSVVYSLRYLFRYHMLYDNPVLFEDSSLPDNQRYWAFIDALWGACKVLIEKPIMATSTEHVETISQQTHMDYKVELANKLTHLRRGQAMVKLPKGEYLMETIPDTSSHTQSPKKQQIIEQTRKKYCRNRFEVEEEIRKRQERDEPPTTKRRGSV